MRHPLEHLRLKDLTLLVLVQRLGTLRAVAQHLHLTQPAVTRMLNGLEQAFGIQLVKRGRRGVTLTPAGQAASERLQGALGEVEQARMAALERERPLLRLGATPIATLELLPRAIGQLMTRLPQARIIVSEAGGEALWQKLAIGELDALLGRLPSTVPLEAGLRHETVARETMVIVARDQHPVVKLGRRRGIRQWQERLAQCQWVLPPVGSAATQALLAWLAQAGLTLPPAYVDSGSFQASMNMVAVADLVTVVPQKAALSQIGALGLCILDVPFHLPPVDLVFATRSLHWDAPRMQLLRSCLKEDIAPSTAAAARPPASGG